MEPKLVEEAKNRPGKCLVSRDVDGLFIDTGCWAREADPYLYLSARWVEDVAQKLLGMVSRAEIEERYGALEARLAQQDERIEELHRFELAAKEWEEARGLVEARNREEAEAAFRDEPVPVDAISAPTAKEFA